MLGYPSSDGFSALVKPFYVHSKEFDIYSESTSFRTQCEIFRVLWWLLIRWSSF